MERLDEAVFTHDGKQVPNDVCVLFEKIALRVAHAGYDYYSARALLYVLRYEHDVSDKTSEFKINDHISPPLARWFLKRHPELPDFFEIREKGACSSTVEPSAHNGLVGGSTPSEPTNKEV